MMRHEFTGKHMAAIMIGGFGIVIAVNLTMASYAVSGFSGVVVDNSYIASQKFNGWLEQEEQQQALGWDARPARSDGRLAITTEGVPEGANVQAEIRRPLGQRENAVLALSPSGEGRYLSDAPLPTGRWIIRVTIESGGASWKSESQIE